MKNWYKYLNRQQEQFLQFPIPSIFKTDGVMVIPCYDEPDISETLLHIKALVSDAYPLAVVVVINSGINSPNEAVLQNRNTYEELKAFSEKHSDTFIYFHPVIFENLPRKYAGVGLGRKIGMDLAVKYFLETQKKDGFIISLDADCLVSENYLSNIFSAFQKHPKTNTAVINFHHRIDPQTPEIEIAIRQYEQYIRYQSQMLEKIGFPYPLHTIGSAFAVKAEAYVNVGGMGRQQGGEDFYFLQKVFALGHTEFLKNTFVYPLARFSDRIPFGTGPALNKIVESKDKELKVYSPESFDTLHFLFNNIPSLFKKDMELVEIFYFGLPLPLQDFITIEEFLEIVSDVQNNSASLTAFQKRFFHHSNAFRIIKYLNFVHPKYFDLIRISEVSIMESGQ